jgi:L-malate glycosyltransferase
MISQRFRILQLIATSGYTGAERYLEGMLSLMKDNKEFEFSIACPKGSLSERVKPFVSEVIDIELGSCCELKAASKIRHIIKDQGISLVHAHGPRAHYIGYIALKFQKRTKLAASVYELLSHRLDITSFKKRLYEFTEKKILQKTAYLSPISEFVKNELISVGIKKENLETLYFGMKFQQNDSIKSEFLTEHESSKVESQKEKFIKEYCLPKKHKFVGTVGRLMPHKGHECFIKALPGLLSNLSDVSALILGDGPLYDNLKRLATDLGVIRSTHFIKHVDDSLDFIRTLDLFMLPSLYESFGIAILEAITQHKPVISSNVGGIPELIKNHESGFLINPEDHGTLSARAIQILTDPMLANKFVKSAFDHASIKFNEESFREGIIRFYRKISQNSLTTDTNIDEN